MIINLAAYEENRKEQTRAALFGAMLCVVALGAVIFALTSIETVILGTELNGNGSVEYLCLGAACENLQAMSW